MRYVVLYVFFSSILSVAWISELHAATVLGVVSPRNAPDVLSGARQFLAANPQHRVLLRTTDQYAELDKVQRHELLRQADMVFAGGVFGSLVELFKDDFSQVELKGFVAVHSDRRLVQASRIGDRRLLAGANIDELMASPPLAKDNKHPQDLLNWSRQRLIAFSDYGEWLLARTFWADRDSANIEGLFRHLVSLSGSAITVPEPKLRSPLRFLIDGKTLTPAELSLTAKKSWVAVIDYEAGDRPGERDLLEQLCARIERQGRGCLVVLAKWGEASVRAVEVLSRQGGRIKAIISLQNFVVGGGEGREQVIRHFTELNVPILKGIRLTDSSRDQWLLSEEGLAWSSVHYRVAMPELQGIVEPLVVAAMTTPVIDQLTGLRLAFSEPIPEQVALLSQRVERWLNLQEKPLADKKVAIVYYNHPPGRHNIGADNLNVPATLFEILQRLKKAGYNTGSLPESEEALLDQLQQRGVNLPEDRQALSTMSSKVTTVSSEQYNQWFQVLPEAVKQEMIEGPLAYLHHMLQRAINLEDKAVGQRLLSRVIEDLRHAVDGANHPARERVLNLLDQLETTYTGSTDSLAPDWSTAQTLVSAIAESGVEGLRGWGQPPGKIMVHRQKILLPGVRFGNVFVGPQPPRGWELNEELLHANLSFPPPHQYVAFYQWLRHGFNADAVVHLGRHSTYEFLPRHRVGMGPEDYASVILGDLPSIYPYIVDGVGEGIQAKRRGLAVMIDHLTPPLDSTELYDQLLELRQLVESYEAAPDQASAMRTRTIAAIKDLVDKLKLRDELVASMSGELAVRGITDFDQVDDELLTHEVGHYLTKLQEDFMPLGLHVFGRDWSPEATMTMLNSMAQGASVEPLWRQQLVASPAAEMHSLLDALNGRYVLPGKGNDPIRTPEALPTGRNFYALDGSLIPSRLGYGVGVDLAIEARRQTTSGDADGIVLWASDVVRDEGAMIAFGFDMLGIKPVWSSRGIVTGLERLNISEIQEQGVARVRRDAVFTTSGLFRDLYGAHLIWLERAVLMALDASSELIRNDYPALTHALNNALSPLATAQNPGIEPLQINLLAARWVDDARAALRQGVPAAQAGTQSAYRVFGDAPGTYGAGVNRMVERSGSWQDRSDIAAVYIRRMSHAYGLNLSGEPLQEVFKQRLSRIGKTYLGRASNLYGLMDNNDAFDYLGGLSLAVETVKGEAPDNFILFHADANSPTVEPLEAALLSELRGRFLNPQWLTPLMNEGYAGARTMGSEFFEYLWGWQVTNPDVVKSWVWDEVKRVYMDDGHNLGLDTFLEEGHNVHVKSNMLAVMLVAAHKEFWQADEQTLQALSEKFTDLILANGLPGSGHTSPDHPLYEWLESYVPAEKYSQLQQLLTATRVQKSVQSPPVVIAEVSLDTPVEKTREAAVEKTADSQAITELARQYWYWLLALVGLLIIGGYRGIARPATR